MSTAYAHGCLNTHHFNLDPLPTRLHITRTQNQLSFDCSAFEVKWYIELRLKWTLNLSISYLGDHCLSVRASSPLKLGSRKDGFLMDGFSMKKITPADILSLDLESVMLSTWALIPVCCLTQCYVIWWYFFLSLWTRRCLSFRASHHWAK